MEPGEIAKRSELHPLAAWATAVGGFSFSVVVPLSWQKPLVSRKQGLKGENWSNGRNDLEFRFRAALFLGGVKLIAGFFNLPRVSRESGRLGVQAGCPGFLVGLSTSLISAAHVLLHLPWSDPHLPAIGGVQRTHVSRSPIIQIKLRLNEQNGPRTGGRCQNIFKFLKPTKKKGRFVPEPVLHLTDGPTLYSSRRLRKKGLIKARRIE